MLWLLLQDTAEEPKVGEQELLAYVAGWVITKVAEEPEVQICSECEKLLLHTYT